MAKRSDFAQKLLDDLRLRKERMAASQSGRGSKPVTGDAAYALAKKSYRGSKEMLTNQTKGFRSGSAHTGSNRDSKSLFIKQTSKDIIPFGSGRSSEHIGDLSMALSFALENGGKLVRKESSGSSSMLAFLNQFSRRSVERGKMDRSINGHHPSTGQFPTLSHLQVKEIAKGAEKLNQILRACSNGLKFDTYSIQIGKDLLKGAMDLEESLRMLVNLQEASDYMTTPKSKTRITLLDDDDEEDEVENTVVTFEDKQLDRPRFSFDKPNRKSHYSQEVLRADLNQRLMALAYLSEATNLHQNRHATNASNSGSHQRSTSYGSNVKSVAAFSEQKNAPSSTKSNSEKGRIPNVIAKLMGLEEPPETKASKSITQKESSSIKKVKGIVREKFIEGNSVKERRTKDVEKLVPSERKPKQRQPNQVQVIQESTFSLQAEKNTETRHASSFEVTIHNGEPPGKDIEGRKLMKCSNKANIKIDRHQANTVKSTPSTRSRHDILDKDRKQNTTCREQKGKEKGYTQELELNNELLQTEPPTQNELEAPTTWQWQTERNASTPKAEKGDPNRLPAVGQAKSHNDPVFHQPYMLHNLEPRDIPPCGADFLQQSEKLKIKARKQKGTEVAARSSSKPNHGALNLQKRHSHASHTASVNRSHMEPKHEIQSKEFQNNRHHENSVKERSSANFSIIGQDSLNKNSSQYSSYVEQKPDVEERTVIPRAKDEERTLQNNQKASTTKQKVATPRKIDEMVTKRSGASDSFAKSPKHRAPVLKEVKKKTQDRPNGSKEAEHFRDIRSKESEVRIIKSTKPIASIQQPTVAEVQAKVEEAPKLPSPPGDDKCQILEGIQNLAPNDSLHSSMMTNDQQSQQIDFGGEESRSQIMSDAVDGTRRDCKDMAYPSQEVSRIKTPEPLTESENHLGQILIKSQLFVNTSEALFRLNIPYDILNSGGHYCQDEERKLILDCGYEIMRRKGKRQELSTHPFMRISITSVKISSLDDLIKQLTKDFETLKLYGRNGNSECLVEDYLPRMLEDDVYNRYSDVNCMWDFGWDALMGTLPEKDDVVRDVERFVLNGLLDEVTGELALVL